MRRPNTTRVAAGRLVPGAVTLGPNIGFSLFPKAGIPQVLFNILAPDGASRTYTDTLAKLFEALAKTTRQREIRRTIARILMVLGDRARTGDTKQ